MMILLVLMFCPLCAYFASRTTPLKIVIYLDGSHTRSALNFYLQRDSALGVCRKSMLQGFALKEKSAKFQNCTCKHPTVPHTSNVREKSSVDVGVGTGDSTDTPVLNAMGNAGECSSSLDLGEARPRTAMAVIPVKIRSKSSNQTIIMYAFLDNGSSATFCRESLMRKLGVDGTKAKICLSTLKKKNSPLDSYLIRDLVVSDLDESHFVHLPTLYTRPEIPVSKNDIPTQEDVDQWPQVDAEIGLLIASDVPKALDSVEVKHSGMLQEHVWAGL